MFRIFIVIFFALIAPNLLALPDSIAESWTNKIMDNAGENMMNKYFTHSGWEKFDLPTKSYSNNIDGGFFLIFNPNESTISKWRAQSWTNKIMGNVGENMMNKFFDYSKWENFNLPTKNSSNGIDGVFVKRNSKGIIYDVMFGESKVNTSKLGKIKSGAQQGSKAYNLEKLNESLNVAKSNATPKQIKDIENIIKLASNPDTHRSRLWHVDIKGNNIKIDLSDLIPLEDPKLSKKANTHTVANFNAKNPTNSYQRSIANSLKEELAKFKYIEPKIEKEILASLEEGKAFRDAIFDSIKNIPENSVPKNIKTPSSTKKLHARTSSSAKIKPAMFGSSVNAAMGASALYFGLDFGSSIYSHLAGEISDGELAERFTESTKKATVVGLSSYATTEILGRVLPNGNILCASQAGAFVISIEMGVLTYHLLEGNIDYKEFQKEGLKSLARGAATAGATYVAVALALEAVSGGIVVIGIGTAAYFITDLAIKEIEHDKFVNTISLEELRMWGIKIESMYEMKNPTSIDISNPTSIEQTNPNHSLPYGY